MPRRTPDTEEVAAAKAAARSAKLRHVTDRSPGISRERTPDGLRYLTPCGAESTDAAERARIRKRAIPPAYETSGSGAVCGLLCNTPSVCRKCYIHPAIFDFYLDGSLPEALRRRADAALEDPASGLTAEEAAVSDFLSRRLGSAAAGG